MILFHYYSFDTFKYFPFFCYLGLFTSIQLNANSKLIQIVRLPFVLQEIHLLKSIYYFHIS